MLFVKDCRLWHLAVILALADAFVPLRTATTSRQVRFDPPNTNRKFSFRTSRPAEIALRDKYVTEPTPESYEQSLVPLPGNIIGAEESSSSFVMESGDLGTEIFFSNLEENLASKEVFDEVSSSSDDDSSRGLLKIDKIEEGVQSQPDSPSDDSSSGLLKIEEAMQSQPDFARDTAEFLEGGSGVTDSEAPPAYEDGIVQDTVSTILAVSSEAVERAEETLAQQVSFEGENVTDSVAPTQLVEVKEMPEILPASEVVGDKPSEKITAPSVAKILRFAVPAIGVWLCGPLLSLIDTSSVGILSGTVQQAALNPSVAVTDYAALLVAYLYTATTNMIAEARETDRSSDGQMPRTTRTFIGAMQMSTFVGAGLGAVLFVFAKQLLRAIIGNDGISPAVFAAAMKYVRIRALGMPAAAVIGSAQAACLGMQDIRSPLYVLLAAAVVNFIGDMLFVGSTHPLVGGAAGAAWATVFSQYVAMGMFVRWLTHKPKVNDKARVMDLSKAILELTGKPTSAGKSRRKLFLDHVRGLRLVKPKPIKSKDESVTEEKTEDEAKPQTKQGEAFSVRGFLNTRFRARDLVKFPRREIVKDFFPYFLPVTATQVGRVSGYVAMSHVVSSALGTASMAAQQVIVSLFYCLCPIADSLSLTAQSFVPSVAGKKVSKERAVALKEMALNFAKAGGVFGGFMVAAVACIPFLSPFFTTDVQVMALVNTVAPLLVGFFGVHGVLCACEGLLLGQKDLGFLGRSYATYFVAVPYFMLRVKRAALRGTHAINLASVWKVFLAYQFSRTAAWVLRVLMIQRRTDREAGRLSP